MPKLDNKEIAKNEIRADQREWVTIKTLNQVDRNAALVAAAMGERLNEEPAASVESPIVSKRRQNRQQGENQISSKGQQDNIEVDDKPDYDITNVLTNDANPAYEAVSAQLLNTSMGERFVPRDPDFYEKNAEKFIEGSPEKTQYRFSSTETALLSIRVQAVAQGRDAYITSELDRRGINITQLAYQNPDAYELLMKGFEKAVGRVAAGGAVYVAKRGVPASNQVFDRFSRVPLNEIRKVAGPYMGA